VGYRRMKEIDFIPEWYKTGLRRRVSYHRQYTMILCLFVALLAWSYSAGNFLSTAKAMVEGARNLLDASEPFAREHAALLEEIRDLTEKAEVIERIRTRTPVENVLAELSHLIGDRVVLGSIELFSEALRQEGAKRDVVVISRRTDKDASLPDADSFTKVVLAGIAADAADVAALIAAMENSSYFCRIIPEYSRNKEVRGYLATEFQITAHVADYILTSESASP